MRSPIPARWLFKKACGGKPAMCLWRTKSARRSREPNRCRKIGDNRLGPSSLLECRPPLSRRNAGLRVGAAKVDVTPAEKDLPKSYEGILDHLYSRAIVVDSGTASTALISLDAGGISDPLWQGVTKQVESELGIPAKNVFITATHTHSAPGQQGTADICRTIVESVQLAKQRAVPPAWDTAPACPISTSIATSSTPRPGAGGKVPTMRSPSDKTVAVIKFEQLFT